MLTRRQIGPDDDSVFEDGQYIGRIRLARDRTPALWLWNVTVTIPARRSATRGASIRQSEGSRQRGIAFKEKHGAEKLATAFEAIAQVSVWRSERLAWPLMRSEVGQCLDQRTGVDGAQGLDGLSRDEKTSAGFQTIGKPIFPTMGKNRSAPRLQRGLQLVLQRAA